jgi:hypothetical protein
MRPNKLVGGIPENYRFLKWSSKIIWPDRVYYFIGIWIGQKFTKSMTG